MIFSRQSTTSRRKHGLDRHGEEEQDDRETVRPDLSQVRQLRQAYFSGKSRNVPVRKAKSKVAFSNAKSTHKGERSGSNAKRLKPQVRTVEYVYRNDNTNVQHQTRHSSTRTPRTQSSLDDLSRNSSPDLTNDEVGPDDSVSQVASRSSRRRRHHRRGTSKRSTLPAVPEELPISTAKSKRRRGSGARTQSNKHTVESSSAKTQSRQRGSRSAQGRRTTVESSSSGIAHGQTASRIASHTSTTEEKKNTNLWREIFARQSCNRTTSVAGKVDCLTCGTDDIPISKAAKLNCGHAMCHACLRRVFKLSVQDPAHMPPKCCTTEPIPLKLVGPLFDLRFKLLFNKKLDEYNTKNRIYCPNKRCGVWIRPSAFVTSRGRKYACCTRCGTKACIHCNQKLHKSLDCPKDPDIAKLVAQAEAQGWKRCFSCKALVELKEGCNHMTCRCLAEFCYVCGAKWKTCDCPWFSHTDAAAIDDLLPQPIEVVIRRVRAAYQDFVAPATDVDAHPPVRRGYRAEMDRRRRQEADDEELARRMQFADLD